MNIPHDDTKSPPGSPGIDAMTAIDLAALGQGQIAYVKTVNANGRAAFAVHAANGNPLAIVNNRDLALVFIRQNDLEPFSVH